MSVKDTTSDNDIHLKTPQEKIVLSPIQQFYNDSSVFITGSTGFVGQLLLEKLLRSCPGMTTVYVLIRNKQGKDLHTRLDELFDCMVFDSLRKHFPKFRHKVVGVSGDCNLPDLGMSSDDRKVIMEEVNIIFHVAATVRFDEKLKTAVPINVRATRDILLMAQKMPQLKSFMHVSTAFSNCIEKAVEEKVYPPLIEYKKLILLADILPEKLLEAITPKLLDKYPNTYTFTKQIAEDAVRDVGRGLPVAIFRPAIVGSTYKEPIPAWVNNINGPSGVAAGVGLGIIRTMHCDPNANTSLVPGDMTVNALIAAAWEVGTAKKEVIKEDEMPVYNYESNNENPLTWSQYVNFNFGYALATPSAKAMWYPSIDLQKIFIVHYITRLLVHAVPALLVDTALICMGKSPKMTKIYTKVNKFCTVLAYFTTRSWIFEIENVKRLYTRLSPEDRRIFFCDIGKLNWDEYFQVYGRGIRVYVLQDPIDTAEEGLKKYNRFYWAHQFIKAVFFLVLLRILWFLVSLVI